MGFANSRYFTIVRHQMLFAVCICCTVYNNNLIIPLLSDDLARTYCFINLGIYSFNMKALLLKSYPQWSLPSQKIWNQIIEYDGVKNLHPHSPDRTAIYIFMFWYAKQWPHPHTFLTLKDALWMLVPRCHALCSNVCNIVFKPISTSALQQWKTISNKGTLL